MSTISKQRKAIIEAEKEAARGVLAMKAYRMKRDGRSLWDIAEECQITEAAAANLMTEHLLEASRLVSEGSKRLHLTMEVDRLDQLQGAIWRQAMSGDLAAVREARMIIHDRAAMLNLGDMSGVNVTNNTVVVAGNTAEYIEALKAYANHSLEITDGQS